MKFLDTKYPSLLDGAVGSPTISNNAIYFAPSTSQTYAKKNTSSTKLYIKFRWSIAYSGSNFIAMLSIVTSGSNIRLLEKVSQLTIRNNTTSTDLWTGGVPSSNGWPTSLYNYRDYYIHIDTVLDVIELYSDGIKYAAVSAGFAGEIISEIWIGKLASGALYSDQHYLQNIIISDTEFPVSENITEVTPTITSTDWTVSSGVATTDSVGGSMTLTAPSGSIDETRRSVTGYGVAFLDASSAETINALNITQDSTTKQVLLPSSGAVETADTFTVSQASDISATAVATYVSQ